MLDWYPIDVDLKVFAIAIVYGNYQFSKTNIATKLDQLTHCGLMTQYGDRDLGQRWLRYWLVAWQHQAITWTNVDLS